MIRVHLLVVLLVALVSIACARQETPVVPPATVSPTSTSTPTLPPTAHVIQQMRTPEPTATAAPIASPTLDSTPRPTLEPIPTPTAALTPTPEQTSTLVPQPTATPTPNMAEVHPAGSVRALKAIDPNLPESERWRIGQPVHLTFSVDSVETTAYLSITPWCPHIITYGPVRIYAPEKWDGIDYAAFLTISTSPWSLRFSTRL